jgi:hypothetical protein
MWNEERRLRLDIEVVRGARDARVRRPAVVKLRRAAHDVVIVMLPNAIGPSKQPGRARI